MKNERNKGTIVSDKQYTILWFASSGINDVDELSKKMGVKREDIMRDLEELKARGLLNIKRISVEKYRLTKEGEHYLKYGFPEELLIDILSKIKTVRRNEIYSLVEKEGKIDKQHFRIALQHLAKNKVLLFEKEWIKLNEDKKEEYLRILEKIKEALRTIDKKGGYDDNALINVLKRRKLIEQRSLTKISLEVPQNVYEDLKNGLIKKQKVITLLTSQILSDKSWINASFKEYDVSQSPPKVFPGKKHPYLDLLDQIREILISMGFEEIKGPHVELELWNFDALFQAQDHPAREIHDTYFLKYPTTGKVSDKELLERISLTHKNGWITGSKGWGYEWDPRRALRLILRTQTTAVSVRTLYERGDGEYMCFSLDRVFRPENLDAKHSMEFYQLEGIIVGEKVTFRHLIGFFNELANRLGLGKVKVKPAYFPFTEPSVEGFIKHPTLGWMEVFPGGMFRPEVLIPLGVKKSNVAAWGIGIDRIAMSILGIDDIRLLFSQDLDFLRRMKKPVIRSLVEKR
ncbi:MAG: phenylalanine--tRNA ligase subunit alpha [Thermofilum sp. ex4484_79]|nr:MAG: phenylalanine--tRNA ligase subunit alpha [Thermofilum sp. ex4484_79]